MEKITFYKLWYFDDLREKKRYYFEDKRDCEIARFSVYSKYDYERLTKRGFVVPVTRVRATLVYDHEINDIKIYKRINEVTHELE